jgi:glutaredoxin
MNKIEVYASETCPYCKKIKEELDKNNIKYKEKLITKFEKEWQDIVMLTGLGNVPTIVLNGNIFHPGRDYGHPSGLISLLENFKESKYSESRQAVEKLKTLNQNMVHAFQRIYADLNEIKTKINKDEHESTN